MIEKLPLPCNDILEDDVAYMAKLYKKDIDVSYEFLGTNDEILPDEINELLPTSESVPRNSSYTAKNPIKETIILEYGGYIFKNYDINSWESNQIEVDKVKINGTWEYKKVIRVTANSITKPYGQEDPPLTYTYKLIPEDNDVTPVFSGNIERDPGENIGSFYSIKQGSLTLIDGENFNSSDYILDFVEGIFTITNIG